MKNNKRVARLGPVWHFFPNMMPVCHDTARSNLSGKLGAGEPLVTAETTYSHMKKTTKNTSRVLRLATMGATMAMVVLATAVQGAIAFSQQLISRPLTPQEVKDYALTGAQLSGGLTTVGIGTPVYLDLLIDSRIAPSCITNVTFALTNRPIGSAAALAASPLGTNVPPYNPADRLNRQVPGRQLLIPDVEGQYDVTVFIGTTTNGSATAKLTITAGTYMGINNCALCHSGGIVAPNKYTPWTNTLHSHAFKDAVDGVSTDHFQSRCISCHVVGYDTNALANNGGFDDIAKLTGWTFPTNFAPGNSNWASMPAALKNVANIQCESCHGPGSQHFMSAGSSNKISTVMGAGSCNQCHDSLNHHYKAAEWQNSRHAIATRTPSGAGREFCVRCHTAYGFKDFIATGNERGADTRYEAITCAACHDPHDATNPHQLRAAPLYTLPEGTTITNAGLGALCMQCHHSRNGSASNNIYGFQYLATNWVGGKSFGPHDSTAGEMIEGVGGIEYGRKIPSGSHALTISNTCVGCHMQEVPSTDPGFTKVGGHTFSMSYSVVTNGVTNHVARTEVCKKCHGEVEDFDLVRKDYNGDGVIEGVQTEVQRLLDKLSTLLPPSTYKANPADYVADGKVKSISRTSGQTNMPVKFLNAMWNHMFVSVEGSRGIHNAPYAIGLLKASIADLTDDWNNDGLPDTWQIANFGSIDATNATPNAAPAGDGVPNWLKYSLGINPMTPGIAVPDGVIWAGADGTKVINPPGTNTVLKIYTAAEVAFDTEVGKTYQIQAVSALGGGWQNIGTPITGDGNPRSYVTPIRKDAKQFYRVVVTP